MKIKGIVNRRCSRHRSWDVKCRMHARIPVSEQSGYIYYAGGQLVNRAPWPELATLT